MSDLPPPGPPPPKVPEGWKAVWNNQYSEYFYVNLYTKKSQWDKPNEPVYPPGEAPPDGPPPYIPSSTGGSTTGDQKHLGSNNPFAGGERRPSNDLSEDERLARRLQEEENARAHGGLGNAGDRGAADDFYNQQHGQGAYGSGYPQSASPYPPQSQSPFTPSQSSYGGQGSEEPYAEKGKGKSGGLLGKLLGKASGSSKPAYGQQPMYGQQGYPQQGYGGYGSQQGGYYGGQQQYYAQPGRKKPGIGAGGAAAMGVGGGLLGGMVLGSALSGDGGDGGGDYGGDGGGDYGGDGGGDFGGGDGGGDFGGGDF